MPADLVTIDANRLAALEAVTAAALTWRDGLTGADPILDAIRAHRAALDTDPGLHLAWPEQDQEPVPGVDYLPAGEWGYDRVDETEPDSPAHDRHHIGYSDDYRWYDAAGRAA